MHNKTKSVKKEFAELLVEGVVGAITMVAKGVALCILWEWFVAGTLTSVTLGVAHAIGLVMLLNFAQKGKQEWLEVKHKQEKGVYKASQVEVLAFGLFYPIAAVISAWIIKLFM